MDFLKNSNTFKAVKITLIIIIILFLIVSSVELVIKRDDLFEYLKSEHNFDVTNDEMVGDVIIITIILEFCFALIYLYLIVSEKFSGVLVIGILGLIGFCFSLSRIGQSLAPTIIDVIFSMIEIMLTFVFAFMIRPKSNRRYSVPNRQSLI
jgi:hypothetical protein